VHWQRSVGVGRNEGVNRCVSAAWGKKAAEEAGGKREGMLKEMMGAAG